MHQRPISEHSPKVTYTLTQRKIDRPLSPTEPATESTHQNNISPTARVLAVNGISDVAELEDVMRDQKKRRARTDVLTILVRPDQGEALTLAANEGKIFAPRPVYPEREER